MTTKSEISQAASALGRLGGLKGGRAKSEAKSTACKANGAKGGRPRNCTQCGKPSKIMRGENKRRGANDEWVTIIAAGELLCLDCAAARGARSLQEIHDGRKK